MLKAKFEINEEKLNDVGTIELLNKKEINIDKINSLVGCDDWVGNLQMPEIKKLIVSLGELDDFIKISIAEKELEFENYDNLKKLFIVAISEDFSSELSISTLIQAMMEADELEKKFKKCVLKFTTTEMKRAVLDLFSEKQYHKSRSRIRMFARYQDFYKEYIDYSSKWLDILNDDVIKEVLGEVAQNNLLTKKNLIDLFSNMDSAQDAIIPLLIFEGVKFSKVDMVDELRHLNRTDIQDDQIIIHSNPELPSRVLEMDEDVRKAVKEAINQDYFIRGVRGKEVLTKFVETKYLLRAGAVGRKKIKNFDDDVISFTGVYNRLTACRQEFKKLSGSDVNLNPNSIEKFGKIHYTNEYIDQGYELKDAIIKTLQRFGTWYYDGDGKSDPRNIQLIHRFKKVWNIYTK